MRTRALGKSRVRNPTTLQVVTPTPHRTGVSWESRANKPVIASKVWIANKADVFSRASPFIAVKDPFAPRDKPASIGKEHGVNAPLQVPHVPPIVTALKENFAITTPAKKQANLFTAVRNRDAPKEPHALTRTAPRKRVPNPAALPVANTPAIATKGYFA